MTYKNISSKQLKEILSSGKKDFILVDTRTPKEHEKESIPKTDILIPFNHIKEKHLELKASTEKTKILLYCRSGNRSAIAAKILARLGYKNLFNLEKGIIEWKAKENKTKKEHETG